MYFLDTNALLNFCEDLERFGKFAISNISLIELENIKTNKNKDENIKYNARKAIHWIDSHEVIVVIYDNYISGYIKDLEQTADNKIIACANRLKDIDHADIVFVTEDISCKMIAKNIFDLEVYSGNNTEEEYKGFKEIELTDEELADFYQSSINENIFKLKENQYLIIKNNGNIVDSFCWRNNKHDKLFNEKICSRYFDKLKVKDIYQSCVVDSIMNNTLTAISGKAGSGKTLLSLMCIMNLIEKGKYESVVLLFNPTKARGTQDMGAYKGNYIDKAMQNNIGNILTTKFGDRLVVDLLLQQGKLKLVSMADCRGMEIKDSEILFITEAENTTVDLIKLCLSRVSSGAKIVVEGDYESQADSKLFDGYNNGLRRIIDKLSGQSEVGCVQLQNVWRSKIAELCELL